jgi:FlaA1/EpsC-like NDP-sugar epimerase
MTISEAAQLVLQSSAMGLGGDVFVLDMGEPMRILDLAKRMIRLSGYEVLDSENIYGDIAIEFTGLRPAEKLYEELLLGDEVTGTGHPMIMRAEEEGLPLIKITDYLKKLDSATEQMDCSMIKNILLVAVNGFEEHEGMHDFVWNKKQKMTEGSASNVQMLFPNQNPDE